jgi:histone deacetylase 1/2
LKAADEEFASLLGMQTWKLVPRPAKRKIIKSKWVFKIESRPDQSIQKLKARLVAMGYSQVQGLDYDEVFSPTLRLETLRLIFSLLASRNWKGRQVDFKTAFLNGHLDTPIYMEQPPGFEDPQHPDWVCEVSRSLYGLKQSPRQWNVELHKALLNLGLTNSAYDPTLYFKIQSGQLIGALTTHVDDLAIVGEPSFVDSLISSVGKRFKIGADEDLNHFLSIKITRDIDNRHVFMNQSHYISELRNRFLEGAFQKVSTPTDSSFKNLTHRSPSDPVSSGPYPQIIGSLLWVSQCTRPDISFAVNKLSQYLRDPSLSHWAAAVRILNYLCSTADLKLRLGGNLDLAGYSDSNWAEDRDDRRSTSAYIPTAWETVQFRGNQESKPQCHFPARRRSTKHSPTCARKDCGSVIFSPNCIFAQTPPFQYTSTTKVPKPWQKTLNTTPGQNTSMRATISSRSAYRTT